MCPKLDCFVVTEYGPNLVPNWFPDESTVYACVMVVVPKSAGVYASV